MDDASPGPSPLLPGGSALTPLDVPAPGAALAGPALGVGDRLAGRYRLVRPVPAPGLRPQAASPDPPALWLAHDEVLARPVAAKLLRTGGQRSDTDVQAFLRSAASAGAVSHPVLVRVYDAAEEPGAATAYVISEWVDGLSLAAVLTAEGAWEPDRARALVTDLLDALVAVHDAGLVHGRVHPGNLLIGPDGGVRLTDVGLAEALPDRSVPAVRATDPDPRSADVRDLAAVLYALLTARWPTSGTPQPPAGLPAAPVLRDGRSRGRLTGPSQIRAGVPRALDALVVRALDPVRAETAPALTTPAGLCDALGGTPAAASPRRGLRLPGGRRLPLLGLLLVGLLGSGAYAVSRPSGPTAAAPGSRSSGAARPTAGEAADQPFGLAAAVRDLDPPAPFGRVELLMPLAGSTGELRAADGAGRPAQIDAFRVLDTTQSGPDTTVLTPTTDRSARSDVGWIAGLLPVADPDATSIASLRLFPA